MSALKSMLLGAMLVVLSACGGTRSTKQDAAPVARAETHVLEISAANLRLSRADTIDLGRIKSGEVIRQQLTVRNAGEAPLVILAAQSSCGCTTVDFPKNPLRRGESAPMSFDFNSKGMSGMQIKQVTLTTTASSTPCIVVVRAEVE